MCSITGLLMPNHFTSCSRSRKQVAIDAFRATVIEAEDRGRDSFGITLVTPNGELFSKREIGKPSDHQECFKFLEEHEISYLMNNNRAEPTTEYVAEKSLNDVQPFVHGDWIVAHNGTIANDKELILKYKLKNLQTTIDSAVIPALLCKVLGNEFDPEKVVKCIHDNLIGSYALAIANVNHPGEIILVANYKPLYVAYNSFYDFYLFTSLENYLANSSVASKLTSPWKVAQVPPYSAVYLHEATIEEIPLLTEKANKKALVVCSGGLDSTVVAAKAIKEGYDVTLLHFRYKCRAESSEVRAIQAIADRLHCNLLFVDTDVFKDVIRHSRLTGTLDDIAEGISGAEFAHEWVPARNLIMLAVATGIAEAKGFDIIMLGNNLEESGAYPDNEMEFINKLNAVLPYATQVNKRVQIQMPVGNLMKWEIVKLGLDIKAPLDLSWSCYESGDIHCGNCGPCFMRKTAFLINGVKDMIPYKTDQEM